MTLGLVWASLICQIFFSTRANRKFASIKASCLFPKKVFVLLQFIRKYWRKNGYFKAIYIYIYVFLLFRHVTRFCLFLVCLFLCALFVVRWKHCCSTPSQCSSLNVHTNAVPKSRPTNRLLPISLWSAITLLLYILMAWWPPICFWVHYIRYGSVIAQLHSTVTFYLW